MKKKKQNEMNYADVKVWLAQNNIKVRPSYAHDDYICTSVALPYPVRGKLDRLSKQFGISRNKVITMLVEAIEEN